MSASMGSLRITINGSSKPDQIHSAPIVCADESAQGASNLNVCWVSLDDSRHSVLLKFESAERLELKEQDFLYIPQTNLFFFRTDNQWGVIDPSANRLVRHEHSLWIPMIRLLDGVVIVEDDLKAESCDLSGQKIHEVPVDPPWDATEYDDRIEYDSPVMGKHILRLKR